MLESLKRLEEKACSDYANLHISRLPSTQSSISYFEFGDPDGSPLLCLHGLSVTGLFFEQYHAYFVELGIRAIAPCLLGGIYIPDPAKTIDDLTEEIIELLGILGVDKFDVIGFSWGTLPELALIARVPERIRKAGFLGAMTPVEFLDIQHINQIKSDVRLTLKMVKHTPLLHRCLMWLFCRFPISTLINQFKDEHLSTEEVNALTPGSPFNKHFTRCLNECLRTGSEFFTHGWRMFLDKPDYALSDLSSVASHVEVRLYVAEQDNVHLPYFSEMIAAACSRSDINDLRREISQTRMKNMNKGIDVFNQVYAREQCSIWMLEGAGRIACMLYFTDALKNLMLPYEFQRGDNEVPAIKTVCP